MVEVKQMTAVEWLVEQIENGKIEIIYSDKIHSIKCIPEIIEQAKALEKEQIIEAFKHGELPPLFVNFDAEQYYQATYGK